MMKNVFHFILKDLFVLKILKLCIKFLVMMEKRLDKKVTVNFKIYDVKNWLTSNCNTPIDQYPTK